MRRLTLLWVLVCAISVVPSAGAIIGGTPDGDEHPYVAFVGDPVTRASCSATLVSPTLAVTAAHCFAPGATVVVFPYAAGPRDGRPPVVGRFVPHPDFCKPPACQGDDLEDFVTDDVAVIRLAEPVALQDYARLPKVEKDGDRGRSGDDALDREGKGKEKKFKSTDVQLVGFGVQGFDPAPFSDFSRTVAREETARPNPVVADKFLEIDQEASGFCLGDSGGPVLEKKKDVVLAISSFVAETETCLGPSYSYRLDTRAAQDFIRSFE